MSFGAFVPHNQNRFGIQKISGALIPTLPEDLIDPKLLSEQTQRPC